MLPGLGCPVAVGYLRNRPRWADCLSIRLLSQTVALVFSRVSQVIFSGSLPLSGHYSSQVGPPDIRPGPRCFNAVVFL